MKLRYEFVLLQRNEIDEIKVENIKIRKYVYHAEVSCNTCHIYSTCVIFF